MKSRKFRTFLGITFALLAFGAFSTQTAEAGHRYRRGFHRPRVIYRPAHRHIHRGHYPRHRAYDRGVYIRPRYGFGYGHSYGYGYAPAYGYPRSGGFCY